VHVVGDAQRLERYVHSADRARRQLAPVGMDHLVPAMLEQRAVLDFRMLVQQRLLGQIVRPSELSGDELERHLQAAIRPLQALAAGSRVTSEGADEMLFKSELERLGADPQFARAVRAPLVALRGWPGRRHYPAVLAHGDYCFPNLLFKPGSPQLAGVIDWERSRPLACVGFDALYLVAFAFSAWRGTSPMQVLCMVWDDLCEPTLERLLANVGRAIGLSNEDLRHVALLIWLLHLSRQAADVQTWSAERHRDWLGEPAESALRWLARTK
jgi:aminoglycoside phosphotransferase (APT) family kinase protein